MQQKSGGPPINCSYPSDQRGLQGVYPSSADCGLNNSNPAKAESQNMQPKVIFYPHDQHFTSASFTSAESSHIYVTVFLSSLHLWPVSVYYCLLLWSSFCLHISFHHIFLDMSVTFPLQDDNAKSFFRVNFSLWWDFLNVRA